jgi:acetolactate synthase-1/2/3 large subunit
VQGNEGQLDTREAAGLDAVVEPRYAQVPPFRPAADEESVRATLAALLAAQRPVIVAGGGVRWSGAGAELVALAERLSIPVATSANGKDTIPGTHELSAGVAGTYSRESANKVVNAADLVCFIGTRTGGMTTNFWTVPPFGTRAVQIDMDPQILGRNYVPEVAVLGDARTVLRQLLAAAADVAVLARDGWLGQVAAIKADWREKYREVLVSDDVPIRPERICAELTAFLPGDAIVLADTGHAGMWMSQFYDTTAPEQSYLRSAGHLGWAFSAGIGAKAAAPERPTFVFTGDSGLHYHLAEIETAVRWGLNSITVVNNNSGGNQSKRGFDRAYGGEGTPKSHEMWTFEPVNFARIAEEMGALGIRVDKAAQLPAAFEQAVAADRPVIVDVVTDVGIVAPLVVT